MRATTTPAPAVSYTAPIVTPFPAPQDPPKPTSVLEEFITEQTALVDMADEIRVHGLDALHAWELDEPASDFATNLIDSRS